LISVRIKPREGRGGGQNWTRHIEYTRNRTKQITQTNKNEKKTLVEQELHTLPEQLSGFMLLDL
jgi:hypothetical protein